MFVVMQQRAPIIRATRGDLIRLAKESLRELLHRFRHLLSELDDVTVDHHETTHQLRVTSRRADTALRIFKDLLPHQARLGMRQLLKRIRRDAGAVRDLDLLARRWDSTRDADPQELQPLMSELRVRVQTERAIVQQHLHRWVHKSRLNQLHRNSKSLVQQVHFRGQGSVVRAVSQRLRHLVTDLQESLSETSTSLLHSHHSRIHARRLRYAVELLQAVLPDEMSVIHGPLVRMQEQLGEINDDAMVTRFLRGAMTACHDPQQTAALQGLIEHSQVAASERLSQWNVDASAQLQTLTNLLGRLFHR